ncbi:hypothetical protein N7492_007840 [Penicillium capsulatum]|uniref:RecF/RecN/SMC N-terminal domain-containing protein n=1 Tax=Penicillium capsulatum TaxID=69766 RepID=A0A9W9I2U8_9EURO|nr:hypothetical protein N7492_007840 [Penicillium capsulatum]
MSSHKRLRNSSDSEEEQSDTGSESSSRKRQRTSESPLLDSENDEIATRPSPLGDEESLDDDELELRQTQILQEKYAHVVDETNVPAEHGILERVECYRFMCHDHFSVELGPLINFVASATNRGQSLKNFIKEGKDNAAIIVRIKNQGDGAYLPDEYGKSIIVERHFSRNGTSGFKIKSENGRIISTKKAELDSITDYFSLQIDNPMNVLSQDMARQFLSTASPTDKYKFFVKGVQLEQLDQDYRLIEESVDQIEEKLRSKAEDILMLERQKDAAQKRLELSDQHDSLRARIKNLQGQMAWAQVEQQEKIRDHHALELDQADSKITEAEQGLGHFDVEFESAEREAETAAEVAYQADSALEEARSDLEKHQEELDATMKKRYDLQAEQRQIRTYLQEATDRLKQTQERIDGENRRLAGVNDGSYARKQEESQQATRRAAEAREEHESHVQGEASLREALQRAEKEADAAQKLVDSKKTDISQAENFLQGLTREDGQRQKGFPNGMPGLIKAIQQEKSFTTPPIGPIGDHITLLKQKWSSILENSFGGTLSSFIVSNKRDQSLLSNIMRRVRCNCPIFIGSGGDIDTSANEPDPQYDTALRVLHIDNPMVRRQLIINHSVEQMLLIEDLDEATSVLYRNRGERARNVKRCYSIDWRDRRRGITLSYNRTNDPSQAPVPIYQGHPRMNSDAASRISAQREVVEDLKRQLNGLEQELRSARGQVTSCKEALDEHHRRSKELNLAFQSLDDHAEALRDALDRESAEDGGIEALRSTLKDTEEEQRVHEGSLADSDTAMKESTESIKLMRRTKAEKEHFISDLLEKSRVAESERSRVDIHRRQILSEKNAAIAQIEMNKQDRQKVLEKKEQSAATVLRYTEMASSVSARVPVDEGETAASLDHKLTRLQIDMERYNRRLGASRDEIAAEAAREEAKYLRAMKQVDELKTLAQIFKDTLDNRKKRWEIFRSHISSRAKAQFTYLLSERSFRGRLLTNHKEKKLDLQVEPDITKDDSTGRGAKTLSGGEKSFSQVCLLLALWEAMGSPIRCLDEFDVYMDHINRKMAIDMLMIAARRSIGRQFILITPGSRTDITMSADVRVKELAEPERGQTTLAFQRR